MHANRRRNPILAVGLGLALVATACGDGGGGDEAASVVRSSKARHEATSANAVDGATVVRHLGAELYGPFAEDAGDGNLAYSPASIALALGMTRAGAEGSSAQELDELFGTTDPAVLHAALNGLGSALEDRAGDVENAKGEAGEVDLSLANSIWGQEGVEWRAPFLDTLQQDYGVGLHEVDYRGDPDGARRQINGWVADETHDKITDLIPEDVISEDARLTLVNALYLAAPWDVELDDRDRQPFTTAAGEQVQAPMMGHSGDYGYQDGDGWQAVTLPYAGGHLAMTLLVPDAGTLGAVEGALDDDLLEQVLTAAEDTSVDLTMPLFDLDSRPPLTEALKALGVTEPFTTTKDFEPMSDDPDAEGLQIAAAIHQATVQVDEQGTVAAAATAVVMEATGAPIQDEPKELLVDRPFLFLIHDVDSAAPLFIGRVGDPTAS